LAGEGAGDGKCAFRTFHQMRIGSKALRIGRNAHTSAFRRPLHRFTDSPARQPAWRVLATLTRAGPHYPGPTIISCRLGNYATQLSLTCAGSRRRISSTLPIGFLFLLLPGNGIIIIALLPPLLMLSAGTILNPSFTFK